MGRQVGRTARRPAQTKNAEPTAVRKRKPNGTRRSSRVGRVREALAKAHPRLAAEPTGERLVMGTPAPDDGDHRLLLDRGREVADRVAAGRVRLTAADEIAEQPDLFSSSTEAHSRPLRQRLRRIALRSNARFHRCAR
jgi:hypothetical protein